MSDLHIVYPVYQSEVQSDTMQSLILKTGLIFIGTISSYYCAMLWIVNFAENNLCVISPDMIVIP